MNLRLKLTVAALIGMFCSGGAFAASVRLDVNHATGTVRDDEVCPTPRNSEVYLSVAKAVECSMSGDRVKIAPGRYVVRTTPPTPSLRRMVRRARASSSSSGETTALFDLAGRDLRIRGAGPNQTILDLRDGIPVEEGKVVIQDITIVNGVGDQGRGGAVANTGGDAFVTIKNSVFLGNDAGLGGALYNAGAMRVVESQFSQNSATNEGGAIFNEGDLFVLRSLIVRNRGDVGGGVYAGGGTTHIEESLIANNFGEFGLVYFSDAMVPSLRDTVVQGNAFGDCAVIWGDSSPPEEFDCEELEL